MQPKSTQTQPKLNPKSTQSQPKLNPNSTQTQPKLNPKSTYQWKQPASPLQQASTHSISINGAYSSSVSSRDPFISFQFLSARRFQSIVCFSLLTCVCHTSTSKVLPSFSPRILRIFEGQLSKTSIDLCHPQPPKFSIFLSTLVVDYPQPQRFSNYENENSRVMRSHLTTLCVTPVKEILLGGIRGFFFESQLVVLTTITSICYSPLQKNSTFSRHNLENML